MKELLEQAYKFLAEHQDINEVELEQWGMKVHLIRFSPQPVTYTGWTYPLGYSWTPTGQSEAK